MTRPNVNVADASLFIVLKNLVEFQSSVRTFDGFPPESFPETGLLGVFFQLLMLVPGGRRTQFKAKKISFFKMPRLSHLNNTQKQGNRTKILRIRFREQSLKFRHARNAKFELRSKITGKRNMEQKFELLVCMLKQLHPFVCIELTLII